VSSALERVATLLFGRSGMDDGIVTESSSSNQQPLRPKEGASAVDDTGVKDKDSAKKNLLVCKTSNECSEASAQ